MSHLLKEKYCRLPLALQYKVVEEKGDYITRRRHLTYNVELFELDNFYVEVVRSMATNQIYRIECPENDYVYDKYLQDLKIEELF
jgi:hypothetical protein